MPKKRIASIPKNQSLSKTQNCTTKLFKWFTGFTANIFCLETYGLLSMSATYIQVNFRLDFIMEADTMNPEHKQTREMTKI